MTSTVEPSIPVSPILNKPLNSLAILFKSTLLIHVSNCGKLLPFWLIHTCNCSKVSGKDLTITFIAFVNSGIIKVIIIPITPITINNETIILITRLKLVYFLSKINLDKIFSILIINTFKIKAIIIPNKKGIITARILLKISSIIWKLFKAQ